MCLVKFAVLLVDPHPSFHFGDSAAYLATAVLGWIPPDRSFSYGFMLRPLALLSHSLIPVVIVQVLLSAIASTVAGIILMRYFRVSRTAAACFSVLCAIEPLQLMVERFIMAESMMTFGFALFVLASLEFLETGALLWIILSQATGVVLFSLRFSFLPMIFVTSTALPLLARRSRKRKQAQLLLVRLAVAIGVSQGLLYGYQLLYGTLAHTEPAYLSRDGEFLVADVAPLVTPQDFPITRKSAEVFKLTMIPLGDIHFRRFHRWLPGGICNAILQVSNGDETVANRLSRDTAIRAIRRNPFGTVGLMAHTYLDFLNYKSMDWALKLDAGHFRSATTQDAQMIKSWFGIDASDRQFNSATKRWEGCAVPWCWIIVTLPAIYAVEIGVHWRKALRADVLLLIMAFVILLTASGPVEMANPRYLVPLPWLCIVIMGAMYSRFSGGMKLQRQVTTESTNIPELLQSE